MDNQRKDELALLFELNAWRSALMGLCFDSSTKTPQECAAYIKAKLNRLGNKMTTQQLELPIGPELNGPWEFPIPEMNGTMRPGHLPPMAGWWIAWKAHEWIITDTGHKMKPDVDRKLWWDGVRWWDSSKSYHTDVVAWAGIAVGPGIAQGDEAAYSYPLHQAQLPFPGSTRHRVKIKLDAQVIDSLCNGTRPRIKINPPAA